MFRVDSTGQTLSVCAYNQYSLYEHSVDIILRDQALHKIFSIQNVPGTEVCDV